MTLEKIQMLVNEALRSAGMDIDVPVNVNNRLTSALGRAQCSVNFVTKTTSNYKIEISGLLMKTNDDDEIRQTVLHECAHVLAYYRYPMEDIGHGAMFKTICAEIGCNEANAQHSHRIEFDWKYVVECPHCHKQTGFMRKCNIVKNPERYMCGLCNTVGLKLIKG